MSAPFRCVRFWLLLLACAALPPLQSAGGLSDIEWSAIGFTISENSASLSVRAVRSGDLSGASIVSFATSNGTALAGSEFVGTNGALVFASGESNKTFGIHLLDDGTTEPTQWFSLRLFNPSNTVLGLQSNALVTIVDDEFSAVLDPWFDLGSGADNDIFAVALGVDGRIIVGGQFTAFNRVAGLEPVMHFWQRNIGA